MARGGRIPSPLVFAAAVCAVLAVASLALPSGPTYDSYSWLIWGRELAHLTLSTSSGGTSWKPLPSLVAALLSPLGSGAADAWLVIARAGALFAVVMAFRVAWRLAPDRGRLVAGLVSAAALLLTRAWFKRNAVGDAEGLMTALGLLAIDRHLGGRRGHAFWLIVVAGLIRVEAWPFAAAYGAWLVATRQARWRVPAGGLLIAVLWFGGDWVGSGSLTTAAGRARHPIVGSPGASAHPALGVLHEAVQMLPPAAWAGVVVVLIAGLVSRRARPIRAGLVLGGCAAVWTAIVALMAQRGYPGLPRFLFMASALEAVVAGIGAALVVERLTTPATARARRRALVPATVAVCTAFAFGALPNARLLPGDAAAVDQVADMDDGLAKAVTQAGGATVLARCGQPVTPWYAVKALEWDLSAAATSVQARDVSPRRLVFLPDRDGAWDIHARDCPKLA